MKPQSSSLHVLRSHATLPNPKASLPPKVLLLQTPQTIAIFDAFPKAKYHFLVLPRYPFPPHSDPSSKNSICKLDELDDLTSLLRKSTRDVREEILRNMMDTAREVEEMIRDEMFKSEGFEWKVDIGFHAIPSMKHLHLHVISDDMSSVALKTKKHYNSFRPDLGFFIDIMEVQRWAQEDRQFITERVSALPEAETLLKTPLSCFKCDEPFHNIPKLKQHLETEFADEKRKETQRMKREGRRRGGEDDFL
ncbi:aprataxin, partial [Tremellales sp. Uapishka_1]